MTNFVSSLISRSFTEQPALRPRLASLFEPAVPADFSHSEAPSARSAETPFANDIEVESEAIPNAGRPATTRNHRAPQVEHSRDANSAASSSSQVTVPQRVLAGAEDVMQEPVVATVLPPKALSRASQERESESPIESTALNEPACRSLPARIRVPDREISYQTEHRPQLVVATQAVPEIVVAQQRTASRTEDRTPTRAQRRSAIASPVVKATAESTINVTIGTVEVRATTESKPAQRRAASASPVMSLEAYLQRRQPGGGR
jgi:hypothetical protein